MEYTANQELLTFHTENRMKETVELYGCVLMEYTANQELLENGKLYGRFCSYFITVNINIKTMFKEIICV